MSTTELKPCVVKIGSSTLTSADSVLDVDYLADIAAQIAHLRNEGFSPVVVSSAAIACGLSALGQHKRPSDLPSLQAAASVGQGVLVSAWADAFAAHDVLTSTVLLTRRDTADRSAYLHARDTFLRLLALGVVPIVNENDTVSVEQICFGDNDTLAALVACLVDARLVVILSDVEGLFDANPQKCAGAQLIENVSVIDSSIMKVAGGSGSVVGSGGMVTKLRAARVLMAAGIPLVICNGHAENAVVHAARGDSIGTRFVASAAHHEITPKKLWIALGDSAHGVVSVDAGAREALVLRGASLLAVGVSRVQGSFSAGDIVDVEDANGRIIARGKVSFSRDEVELACGKTREELEGNALLAPLAARPLIHRDELIVFE